MSDATRPTFMTPQRFAALGERIFGSGWQTTMAVMTGYNRSQVFKYVAGRAAIPSHIALLLVFANDKLERGEVFDLLSPVGTVGPDGFKPLKKAVTKKT